MVALSSYHHVSLIQNKHLDLLRVNELELGAPVQNSPRGANDNVFTDLLTSFHCGDKMFSVGISMAKPALEIKALPILSEFVKLVNSRCQNTQDCYPKVLGSTVKQAQWHLFNCIVLRIKSHAVTPQCHFSFLLPSDPALSPSFPSTFHIMHSLMITDFLLNW